MKTTWGWGKKVGGCCFVLFFFLTDFCLLSHFPSYLVSLISVGPKMTFLFFHTESTSVAGLTILIALTKWTSDLKPMAGLEEQLF